MAEGDGSVKTGGCLCGKIKFSVAGTSKWNTICYCLNCRRRSGSAMYTAAICSKDGFKIIEGEDVLSSYSDILTDSGQALVRTFCSNCGSNLFNFTPLNEEIVSISAGAFDDFENWVPTLEQYCLHRATFLDEVRVVKKRSVESIAGEAENVEQDEQAEQPTS